MSDTGRNRQLGLQCEPRFTRNTLCRGFHDKIILKSPNFPRLKTAALLCVLSFTALASAQAQPAVSTAGIAPSPAMNGYAAVPEPSRALLVVAGGMGVLLRRRRQSVR